MPSITLRPITHVKAMTIGQIEGAMLSGGGDLDLLCGSCRGTVARDTRTKVTRMAIKCTACGRWNAID